MKKLFLPGVLLFLISISFAANSSLLYSTLNLTATDQEGIPLQKVEFFLKCKMSFATPERFLCTSDSSGTCLSACMDCAPGTTATVRAKYFNYTIEQNIASWKGIEEGCAHSSEPLNPTGIFSFTVSEEEKKLAQNQTEDEIDGASENLPVNTNIETKDFQLSSNNDSDTENTGSSEATDVKTGESCIPSIGFLLLTLGFAAFKK